MFGVRIRNLRRCRDPDSPACLLEGEAERGWVLSADGVDMEVAEPREQARP